MKKCFLFLILSFSFVSAAVAEPLHGEVNWERLEQLQERLSGVNERFLSRAENALEISKNSHSFIFPANVKSMLKKELSTYVMELKAMHIVDIAPTFRLEYDHPEKYFIRLAMKALYYSDVVIMLNRFFQSPALIKILESDLKPAAIKAFVPELLSKITNEVRAKGPEGVPTIKQRGYLKSNPSLATFVAYLDQSNRNLNRIEDPELKSRIASLLSEKLDLFFETYRQLRRKGSGGFKNSGLGRLIYGVKSNILYVSGNIWLPKRFAIQPETLEELELGFLPGDITLIRHNRKLTNIGLRGQWSHSVLYLGSPEKMRQFFDSDRETAYYYRGRCQLMRKKCAGFVDYLITKYPEYMEVYFAKRKYGEKKNLPNVAIESRGNGVVFSDLYRALLKDQLAVFRPRLPIRERAMAIESAIQQLGKPYDFDFDLRTDGRQVCTELIYNGYSPNPAVGQRGIDWVTSIALGKPNMYGEDIAKTFLKHYDAGQPQMDLITFIKPNPKTREHIPLGVEELRQTVVAQ